MGLGFMMKAMEMKDALEELRNFEWRFCVFLVCCRCEEEARESWQWRVVVLHSMDFVFSVCSVDRDG